MEQKEEILKQIKFMKKTAPEEFISIFLDAIKLYFKSIITFGSNSIEAKECIKVIMDMKRILKEERYLLNIILRNIDSIDLDETCDILESLDYLNDKTYTSYDNLLSEIEIGCDIKTSRMPLKPITINDTLITNDEYKEKVLSLIYKNK